ncbi:MAG: porin [Solimonas sp.]
MNQGIVASARRRVIKAARWLPLLVVVGGPLPAFAAELSLPPISVGAGIRTSFTNTDVDGSDEKPNDFSLNSARLYISGAITEQIKFTLNTEYTGADSADDKVQVIDAIGRFEFSPQLNIWAGRFLPPSDRANLHGPYYANNWGFAVDGIEDGYPFYAAGRDNGVAYWGDFDKLKVSFGAFDVPSTNAASGDGSKVVVAGRVQYDFWDAEPGYYLNSTYYGAKNILALGVAAQGVDGDTGVTVDGLLEKKIAGGGVISIEGEYAHYDAPFSGYGYSGQDSSDGFFGLAAFLFPQKIGIGQIQLLGKYASNTYDLPGQDVDLTTTEFNVNYVIKDFKARVSLFYINSDYKHAAGDSQQIGIGLQLQI